MNVVIFGSVDWTEHWQMHHQLASSFVRAGHRVLYIDNTGVRPPSFRTDSTRIFRKLVEISSSTSGFRITKEKVCVLSPFLIPLPYNSTAININAAILKVKIKTWLDDQTNRTPFLFISFLPTPLISKVNQILKPHLSVYYCANDMVGTHPAKRPLRDWEHRFFQEVDLVFTISERLTEKASRFSGSVYKFPPGLDENFLHDQEEYKIDLPEDLRGIKSPIIGYLGAISSYGDVFDFQILDELANSFPSFNFVLIGPTYGEQSDLRKYKNIHFLGPKDHSDLPIYLSKFDVGIIPYQVNEYTDSVNTCKLNEYLSFGFPIISTPIKEVQAIYNQTNDLIKIAKDIDSFKLALKEALKERESHDFHQLKLKRLNYAIQNSWPTRFLDIEKLLEKNISKKLSSMASNKSSSSDAHILRELSSKRKGLYFTSGLVIFSIFTLFVSPLIPIMGYFISPRDPLSKADVMIVLTGDGSGTYYNQSFLNRANDVLSIHRKLPTIRILISTARERQISEVEVLRLLLLDRGIPKEQINIITPAATSTWEHITAVKKELTDLKYQSLGIISSPLHARRAASMLRKMTPKNKFIFSPSVVDTPAMAIRWRPSILEIKTTIYEYCAYAYAFIKGRV